MFLVLKLSSWCVVWNFNWRDILDTFILLFPMYSILTSICFTFLLIVFTYIFNYLIIGLRFYLFSQCISYMKVKYVYRGNRFFPFYLKYFVWRVQFRTKLMPLLRWPIFINESNEKGIQWRDSTGGCIRMCRW